MLLIILGGQYEKDAFTWHGKRLERKGKCCSGEKEVFWRVGADGAWCCVSFKSQRVGSQPWLGFAARGTG